LATKDQLHKSGVDYARSKQVPEAAVYLHRKTKMLNMSAPHVVETNIASAGIANQENNESANNGVGFQDSMTKISSNPCLHYRGHRMTQRGDGNPMEAAQQDHHTWAETPSILE
jgi:hypothetical protein